MQPSGLLRFGPFELDLGAGELRKHGIRVRLPGQSFQILLLLSERPGAVVPREDICRRLWPEHTFVEYDQSINTAVRRLRSALGETADTPRYVETVAKRGYRFLAEVERVVEPAPQLVGPDPQLVEPAPQLAAEAPPRIAPATRSRQTPGWAIVCAVATLVQVSAGGAAAWLRTLDRKPPLPPGVSLPLTTFAGLTTFPAFSPDGQRVAFAWAGNDPSRHGALNIWVKPVGAGEPARVTTSEADDRLPQWSPDGSRIAFQRGVPNGHELRIVSAGGGTELKIAEMGIGLAWSPDGKEIAYVAPFPPKGTGGISVRTLATGKVRQLTDPRPHAEGLVAWSPDGKLIAFARSLTQSAQELFVVPSGGGEARRLTFDNQLTEGFAWTPDSRELVFVSYRGGGPGLWRVSASGGTPQRVAAPAHHPSYPAISARTSRLAFVESFEDSNIWQYRRSGTAEFGSPKCLICSTVEDNSPRFSPDGRKIVFVSRRTGSDELWVADSDGSYPIQLTSMGTVGNGSPRWSPDGHWIAYDSRSGGSPDVFVVSAQGGSPRQLTSDASAEIKPTWSRDSRWVYFTSDRSGRWQVWKTPFEGGAPRQVTQDSGGEAMESADGKRLYYFRGDHRDGIWTVPVAGGPEAVVPELKDVKPAHSWTVSAEGIYFAESGPDGIVAVKLFRFATRKTTTVATPGRPPAGKTPGLDISPDGRNLLYTQADQNIDGLMMIDRFR